MSVDADPTRADSVPTETWSGLRRFARPQPAAERCELCGAELAAEHEHLLQPDSHALVCACTPCAILFSHHAAGRHRRVPRETWVLDDFQLTDAQWTGLEIPVGLAFFFRSSAEEKIAAVYPSPAGPTQSRLGFDCWNEVQTDNPLLGGMLPDVQALLVNRVGGAREYYLAPIDECYRLVGLLRTRWRGLSGGGQVWKEIGQFFERLRQRAHPRSAKEGPCLT
jgi:hypothetical protein